MRLKCEIKCADRDSAQEMGNLINRAHGLYAVPVYVTDGQWTVEFGTNTDGVTWIVGGTIHATVGNNEWSMWRQIESGMYRLRGCIGTALPFVDEKFDSFFEAVQFVEGYERARQDAAGS